jgi:hypothetical protein
MASLAGEAPGDMSLGIATPTLSLAGGTLEDASLGPESAVDTGSVSTPLADASSAVVELVPSDAGTSPPPTLRLSMPPSFVHPSAAKPRATPSFPERRSAPNQLHLSALIAPSNVDAARTLRGFGFSVRLPIPR